MEFTIENAKSHINMHLTKIYEDTDDFEFCLNVKCGCFVIKDKIIYTSRIDLINFYKKLNECFVNLNGEIKSEFEYDEDIIIYLTFDKLGKVKISCDVNIAVILI